MSAASRCGGCDAPLPAEARFCPACGERVADRSSEAERRVVTVLFADLAGFTTLADGRDPETVKVFLDECFGAMVPVVEAHGGSVDKIIGDELMAVFGSPVAHEDDPSRAVHAALAIIETLQALRPEVILRVGVNTGEVLVGRVGPSGARTVTGDTVNTAHRLVEVAGPSEILVGQRTQHATRDTIRYELRDPYELRGKREPVQAYAAIGRRRTAGRPPEVGYPTRLVGRADQLRSLLEIADSSALDERVRLVQIVAEAGVGKTRLAVELHRRLIRRRDTLVLWGRGRPYGTSDPWNPLGEALRQVFGVEPRPGPDDTIDRLRQRVTELVSPGREPNRVGLHRLAELLGLSEPGEPPAPTSPVRGRRHDEQTAVARTVIEALARDRPVVLVLDDAHAVDPVLLEFVAGLAGRALRLLVVLATRTDLAASTVFPDGALATVELLPLDDAASVELIRVVLQSVHEHDLDEVVLGPSVEDRIVEATGGVPFLIEQTVQYLIDRKLLVSAEKRWEVASDFQSVGLPDTARAMIDARVDALQPGERRFLQNAAVFGRTFWVDAAAALVDLGDADERERIVESLVERGLLGDHVDDLSGDMTFRHSMVRDAVYAAMPIAERAEKHRRVADFLAGLDTETAGAVHDQLAHHSERAVMLARELGEVVEPDRVQRAFERLLAAADDARRRDAEREAERWYTRAEAIGRGQVVGLGSTMLAHAEILIELRRFDRAREILIELLAEEADLDGPQAATAQTYLAVARRLASDGDPDAAAAAFEKAQRMWHRLDDSSGEAFTLTWAGWSELVAGRPRAAQPKLLRAHDLESSRDRVDPTTLRSLGWCEFLLGDDRAAREHLWKAAAGFSDTEDVAGIGWCFGIMGFSLWLEGRIGQAHQVAQALLAAGGETTDPWSEGMMLTLLGACEVERGDVDAAHDPIRRAERLFSEIADPWGTAMVAVVSGMSSRVQGRHDEARRTLEAGLELTGASTSVGEDARLLAELASVELDAGLADLAVEHARSALDLIRSGSGDRDSELRSLVALGRERRRAGDDEGALRFLEEAIDLGDPALPTSAWRRASSHLAMVQARLGDATAARAAADRALRGAEESVRTWSLAMRADAAARAAAGDGDGAVASLRRVLARLDDRPLAFLDYVRRDLTRLAGESDARGGPT